MWNCCLKSSIITYKLMQRLKPSSCHPSNADAGFIYKRTPSSFRQIPFFNIMNFFLRVLWASCCCFNTVLFYSTYFIWRNWLLSKIKVSQTHRIALFNFLDKTKCHTTSFHAIYYSNKKSYPTPPTPHTLTNTRTHKHRKTYTHTHSH